MTSGGGDSLWVQYIINLTTFFLHENSSTGNPLCHSKLSCVNTPNKVALSVLINQGDQLMDKLICELASNQKSVTGSFTLPDPDKPSSFK